MGGSRNTPASQREALFKHASKFEQIVRDALDARYEGNPVFYERSGLKLATETMDLNEGFSELMWKKGQTCRFADTPAKPSPGDKLKYEQELTTILESVASMPELEPIVRDIADCPAPSDQPIMGRIEQYYKESRGPELGTFGRSLLAMIFRMQAANWRGIVTAHVAGIIVVIHRFIRALLDETFVEQRMREELWDVVLLEKLREAYGRAKRHADFLLDIELDGRPSTCNQYFNDNLQKARADRMTHRLRGMILEHRKGTVVSAESAIAEFATRKSNANQVKEDIHDILKSYNKVSRERFVGFICRQMVENYLLDGFESPLKALTLELIAKMTDS